MFPINLLRIWQPMWIRIDDGSGVGIKCLVPNWVDDENSPKVEDYVSVTGVSSCEQSGSSLLRLLKVSDTLDTVKH